MYYLIYHRECWRNINADNYDNTMASAEKSTGIKFPY